MLAMQRVACVLVGDGNLGLGLLGALWRLGHLDAELAIVKAGLDVRGFHTVGEAEAALEGTVVALHTVDLVVLLFVLALALARDGEHVVLNVNLDVILGHAGSVQREDVGVFGLHNVARTKHVPTLLFLLAAEEGGHFPGVGERVAEEREGHGSGLLLLLGKRAANDG